MNNDKITSYSVGKGVMLTDQCNDLLFSSNISKSAIVLFLRMLRDMKGYSYEITSLSIVSANANVNLHNSYKHIKELESNNLIKTVRKESNRIRIFVNPYMVSQGHKAYDYVLKMFSDVGNDDIPRGIRKEKEENISYDKGF